MYMVSYEDSRVHREMPPQKYKIGVRKYIGLINYYRSMWARSSHTI